MIRKTFVILDGIGYQYERRIWDQGIESWDDFCSRDRIAGISDNRKGTYEQELEVAERQLKNQNPYYFAQRLRLRDHWRLYEDFRGATCYLDIETTGLDSHRDKVTVVSLYDGKAMRTFVRGRDLEMRALERELSRYNLLVTFSGARFDLPFLRAHFPGLRLEVPHFDLCLVGRKVGLRGGLKNIERQLGISRPSKISRIDGFEAVVLWNRWEKRRDQKALETLIRYNQVDTKNLVDLAEVVYNKMRASTLPPAIL